MKDKIITKTPAMPLNQEQAAWFMARKEKTGESYGTIFRMLLDEKIKREEEGKK